MWRARYKSFHIGSLYELSGRRGNATDFGYGIRSRHINLYNLRYFENTTILDGALTFVHEFGHHTYDLGDEYRKPGPGEPPARCPGAERSSPTLNYCLMDYHIVLNRTVSEFCVDRLCLKSPIIRRLLGQTAFLPQKSI